MNQNYSFRVVEAEPCNCGDRIMHNNGGNYHQTVVEATAKVDCGTWKIRYNSDTSEWFAGDEPVHYFQSYEDPKVIEPFSDEMMRTLSDNLEIDITDMVGYVITLNGRRDSVISFERLQ